MRVRQYVWLDEPYGEIGPLRIAKRYNGCFLASHNELVRFHDPRHGLASATLHGLHHLALEQPAGFLTRSQFSAELSRGDTLLACGQVIHDVECFDKGEFHLVEDRACGWAFDVVA